ncbi:MAG: BolA family transcriptional regulator [Betaproteobacteria bacterium]|nr:MAG: BolA family transcriptional regulator [Betaproteobacteria bacterium]
MSGAATTRSAADLLAERLAALEPTVFDLHDDSAEHAGHAGAAGGGGHFSLVIVSKAFRGQTRVARHRAVLARVGDLIPHPVHALAIQAYAPEEFPSLPSKDAS